MSLVLRNTHLPVFVDVDEKMLKAALTTLTVTSCSQLCSEPEMAISLCEHFLSKGVMLLTPFLLNKSVTFLLATSLYCLNGMRAASKMELRFVPFQSRHHGELVFLVVSSASFASNGPIPVVGPAPRLPKS